jgi:hypothetical protein
MDICLTDGCHRMGYVPKARDGCISTSGEFSGIASLVPLCQWSGGNDLFSVLTNR